MSTETNSPLDFPSHFSNRFFMYLREDYTRITFAEIVNGQTSYHSSVTMPTRDAVELANLILRLAATAEQAKVVEQSKVEQNE